VRGFEPHHGIILSACAVARYVVLQFSLLSHNSSLRSLLPLPDPGRRSPPHSYFLIFQSNRIVREGICDLLYGTKIESALLMSVDAVNSN